MLVKASSFFSCFRGSSSVLLYLHALALFMRAVLILNSISAGGCSGGGCEWYHVYLDWSKRYSVGDEICGGRAGRVCLAMMSVVLV